LEVWSWIKENNPSEAVAASLCQGVWEGQLTKGWSSFVHNANGPTRKVTTRIVPGSEGYVKANSTTASAVASSTAGSTSGMMVKPVPPSETVAMDARFTKDMVHSIIQEVNTKFEVRCSIMHKKSVRIIACQLFSLAN
jgi:hypothetical protein